MLIKQARFYIVNVCALLLSFPALSYEPENVHQPLLELAIERYNKCRPQDSIYLNTQAQQRVIQGNVAMDKGLSASLNERKRLQHESAFALSKRAFNWHFYNPNKISRSKVLFVEQSHKNLWRQLKKGLNANSELHDKLLFTGGLIHLLEDLTVPAHVLPIYHGPTAVKYLGPWRLKPLVSYMQASPYDTGMLIKDKIDSYQLDTPTLKQALKDDANLCDDLDISISSVDRLRDQSARETLALIQSPIPRCDDSQWAIFWLDAKKGEYFGRYNIANNNILFGMAGTQQRGSQSCSFTTQDDRYRTFVNQLHLNAIKNDMKLLRFVQLAVEE